MAQARRVSDECSFMLMGEISWNMAGPKKFSSLETQGQPNTSRAGAAEEAVRSE
jgi:hypothetical protein